jgi:hypothetical protein
MIAYWTREDPRREMIWLPRKTAMFRFQFGFACEFMGDKILDGGVKGDTEITGASRDYAMG